MENVRRKAHQYLDKHQRISRWHKVVTVLAGVVVFCTTYALILPALTMTTPLICGFETEHTHDESCYTVEIITNERVLTCTEPEVEPHTHDESCYIDETIALCGLEAVEAHTHSDECAGLVRGEILCDKEFDTIEKTVETQVERQEERELIDEDGESTVVTETVIETVVETVTEDIPHEHTDECYEQVEALICGLEETEGHEHTEECGFETVQVRVCETEETEGHIHSDECWFIPENEGEAIEVRTLVCELPEHTHHDNCYLDLDLEVPVTYFCGFDAEHTHNEECYFEDGELKCNIAEHTHTDECLVEPEIPAEPVALDDTFTAESEDGAVVVSLHVTGEVILPELDETVEEPAFELVLTESEDWAAYDEYAELAAEDGEVMMVMVLNYTLTYGGREVDLSNCEVTVEVTPTEDFEEMINSPMEIMTLALENEDEEQLKADMAMMFNAYTAQRGVVAYAVSQGANPSFTVQYYANLERVVRSTSGTLPVIDTTGGKLPHNGWGEDSSPNDNPLAYLELTSNGTIKTSTELTKIYRTESFNYSQAPGLKYINIVMKDYNTQYALNEIWVLKEGKSADSVNRDDWTIYGYKTTTRLTNRIETAQADPENFIFISDSDVFRLVYDTNKVDENFQANFYDYDISNGYVYRANATSTGNTREKTSFLMDENGNITQEAKTWRAAIQGTKYGTTNKFFMYTVQSGINSTGNYKNNGGAKLAFGNANTGTGLKDQKWGDNVLNVFNSTKFGATKSSYKGCTFGMANNLSDGKIVYRGGLDVPKLFNEGSATGKKIYQGAVGQKYSLNFERVGDTYTLSSVQGTTATNLTKFNNPTCNTTTYGHIWTNNFWPMDSAPSWGTDGHDFKFGRYDLKNTLNFSDPSLGIEYHGDNKIYLPISDDGQHHNSYFGMHFVVEFKLTANYVGPLEYYFFGDDDMWVFLNDTLVCDIGGVHSSVGEYVNLWDYINKDDLAKLDEDETKTYTLSFYYTERGASGSTCWMQFTLPTVVGVDVNEVEENTGSLRIEKELDGVQNVDWFEFALELDGVDTYDNYLIVDANGNLVKQGEEIKEYVSEKDTFRLRGGDALVIRNLPKGTTYKITEVNNDGYHTKIYTNGDNPVEDTVVEGGITINTVTTVTFVNAASYELPATGGSGTILYYTMGALMMISVAFLMYNQKKKEGDATC